MQDWHDHLFIGGRWERPHGRDTTEVVSPATGAVLGVVPLADEADIDAAVRCARDAFDRGPWPHMTFGDRRETLARVARLLAADQDAIDELITRENGSPIRFAQGAIGVAMLEFHLRIDEPGPVIRDAVASDAVALLRRRPTGVVGAIVPWNGPLVLAMSRIAPALLAGCTVVLKTPTETPLHTYRLGQAFLDAGLPGGVISIVCADRTVSESLVAHPGVDKIAFTGSTAAGRRIGSLCGQTLKRVSLELGGKSAAVLLDDVDVASVVPTVMRSGLLNNNGEACMAQTRILVPRRRHGEVLAALTDAARAVTTGDPLDPDTEIGPLISEEHRARVEGYIAIGRREGATLVCGGGRPARLESGWYLEPTIFRDVTNDMRIAREEIFGPVVAVIPYDGGDDEAVRLANDSPYGLAAGVYTADQERGIAVGSRLRVGVVGVNASGVDPGFPFGGFKDSGSGRQHGHESILEYLELQTLAVPGPARALLDAYDAARPVPPDPSLGAQADPGRTDP
jgi:aldehyde dehydrogenase (NAD+)